MSSGPSEAAAELLEDIYRKSSSSFASPQLSESDLYPKYKFHIILKSVKAELYSGENTLVSVVALATIVWSGQWSGLSLYM